MKMNEKDMLHMAMNRAQNCAECEFMRMYDYGKRIYCCDHPDRADDMGKLSRENLTESSPEWCPLRCKSNNNADTDLIKMESETYFADKEGRTVKIKVPRPEYSSEIFS